MAEAYLKYLYSPEGQEIAAKNYYRPRDAEVAKKYENAFPKLKLFTIDEEFGGWTKAQKSILLTAVRSIRSANADFPRIIIKPGGFSRPVFYLSRFCVTLASL